MQDSNIVYKVTAVGAEEAQAKFAELGATIQRMNYNANGTVTASGKLSSALGNQTDATNRAGKATNSAASAQENYFVHIAKTTVQSALVNKAFLGIVDSMGKAAQQVDLLQNFPASMAALGLSSKDASQSILTLRDYISKVGGDLATATTSVARFAEVTRNVKAATAEYVGVNNALIAGGAGAEVQANALEQLTQAYSRGKPQLIEWKSLMVAMPAQLNQVAIAMKLPNAQALGEALTKGKVSMQDFLTELTKLSTGTGPIATQAIARMQGIQFASNVMKNALTNGLAAIYQAIGRQNIIGFFTFMTDVIRTLTVWVVVLINDLISLFNWISKVFGGPQIAHFTGETSAAAGNLDDGAKSAGDMADGLGDAADNAKKINKSLASFDKMNVLPDKTSGDSTDDGSGTTGGLDPKTAGALDDIFGNIGGKLKTASIWAKIFAGILAGLATNALVAKLFGINPLKSLISNLGDAAKGAVGLGKKLAVAGGEGDKAGEKVAQSFGAKFGSALNDAAKGLGPAIGGFIGGVAGAISESLLPALGAALAPIGAAIAGVFVSLAAIVGLPVEIVVGIVVLAVAAIVAAIYLIWRNWTTIWGYITTAFSITVAIITSIWNTLFAIFAAPIKFILQFIKAFLILIVALVAIALQAVAALVYVMVKAIYTILAAISGWIYANVITPVVNLFVGMWNAVVAAATAAWNFIYKNILEPIGAWVNVHVIIPVTNFFKAMWTKISGFVTSFSVGIKNIFTPLVAWINAHVIGPIANFFSRMWDDVKTGLSRLMTSIKSIFGTLGGVIKSPINGVIDLINIVLRQLNKIKVPSWVPGLGGSGVNFPMIPKLAEGGVVNQATMAMIGENGTEAVMPLENNTEWIDKLASKINTNTGPSNANPDIIPVTNKRQSPSQNITIQVSGVFATNPAEQKKVADLIAKHLNASLKAKGLQGAY